MAQEAQEAATRAQKLQGKGDYLGAAKAYDEVLKIVGDVAEVYLNKGVVLSAAQRQSEAEQCFDKAIELKDGLAQAHLNRANIYKVTGRQKEACEGYKRAFELDNKLQTALFGLAHVYNELNDFEQALKYADDSIKMAGDKIHRPSHNERLFALIKLDRSSEAVKDVDLLTKDVKDWDKEPKSARKLYAMVLSQAAIEKTNDGDNADALPFHKKASEADPSFKNLFNYAISLIQNDKQDDALVTLEQAKKADPDGNWKTEAAIGTIQMQKQKYKEAAAAFIAASRYPDAKTDETVNFNAGVALMNIGKEAEAIEYLEAAVSANPENWTANALLGTIYIGLERYQEAQNALEIAVSLPGGKQDTSVNYNLGYARLMLDNSKYALESFKKVNKIIYIYNKIIKFYKKNNIILNIYI